MATNHEGQNCPESPPRPDLAHSDIEKGSKETPETQAMEAMDKQNRSVTFALPSVEQPPEESLKDPEQRTSGHDEPFQVTDNEANVKAKSGDTRKGINRLSSLEMRRLPVDVLLSRALNDVSLSSVLSDDSNIEGKNKKLIGEKNGLLNILCLRPGYSLRTQLMLSFGTISVVTIVAVVLTCIIVAVTAGQNVKDISRDAFEAIATKSQGLTSRYIAESLSEKLLLVDVVNLLHEATRDRFAGYPAVSEDDVPFFDVVSGQSKYPVDFPPPPLEWQFESNINEENYVEHFQGQDYFRTRGANTASASFLIQGVCDPSETDPFGDAYWPNCTDANNNISTGGAWQPTDTAELIYYKGKDLIPLLKALYETRDVIRDIGVYFANSGAGASLNYPHYPISTQSTYVSTGCEWMNTPNSFDPSKPIGTPEMIARCSPADEVVSSRIYNPLERFWCRDQALDPDRIHYATGPDSWDNGFWLLRMGKAVYDRITNEFISCTFIGVSLADIDKELGQGTVVEGETISLVNWSEDGTIVSSSIENRNYSESLSIYEAGIGVTEEDYKRLFDLVDYESEWDPAEVRKAYADFTVRNWQFFVSAYPVPPVPDRYDGTYRPIFMVVVSTPLENIFGIVRDAIDIVDERVKSVNVFCITAGVVGLVIALIIISMMAEMITKPLRKMNKIATDIVSNFGDPTKEQAIKNDGDGNVSKESRCTPKTELSEVVMEFNAMVASFSGETMVKSERHKHHEVCNMFGLHRDFLPLYRSRGEADFQYSIDPPINMDWGECDTEQEQSYVHGGTNVSEDHDPFITNPPKSFQSENRNRFSSPLFLWIVALIVTPLLVVNIVITVVALQTVSSEFAESIVQAKAFFLEVEKNTLGVHSRLRATLVSALTSKATGDLHVLTRYAGWLLFGGVTPSERITEFLTGVEECKMFEDTSLCPFVQENTVCDCAWDDGISPKTCRAFPNGSRTLQKSIWACQSQDADEKGNRLMTSYPETSYSPETTDWWDNQQFVPGWENSSISDTGYDSLFERLQTGSSIPVFEAIYNYHEVKDSVIASYVAFESDGLFMGYSGCRSSFHVDFKDFQSTVENGAAQLRPELCPLGKFGYDPRCRGWYHTGRTLATSDNTCLHVTAPYRFATGGANAIAQSATSPLIDRRTEKHVGQVLFDFVPTEMVHIVEEDTPLSTGGFRVVVATESAFDADTVIGPDYKLTDPPSPIASKVLPIDVACNGEICRSNVEAFNKIVHEMKAGSQGIASFYRTNDGGAQEKVHIAYAPVSVSSFCPLDSSNFSRGLNTTDYLIYSLALVETESGIFETFDPIEDVTQQQIHTAIVILSVLLLVATFLVVYVSILVTQSIAEPMVYLLEIIRSIRISDKDAPALRTVKASQEIVKFADSIEMLSTVVRSANRAFHIGEFEVAYFVLVDALRLFRRLDNKKAIGIACNNLGNIMMGMYQEMTKDNIVKLAGLTKHQLLIKGIAYYNEAIQLGEKSYDEFYALHGWTPICLDFMQHLSNRYFNRGLFLLSSNDTHNKPSELEELGKRDLSIASDMDSEVIAYGEDIGWSSTDRIGKTFDVKIVRTGGYNLLLKVGFEDEWGIKDLLDEAYNIIVTEKKLSGSELFSRMTCYGRMQELEMEIMKYYEAVDDIDAAAKVAIRCLVEDEKVFVDTLSRALEVLLKYVDKQAHWLDSNKSRIKNKLQDYTHMVEDTVTHQTQASLNDMESDVISKATGGSGRSHRFSAKSWSLQQSSGRFVTMEDF